MISVGNARIFHYDYCYTLYALLFLTVYYVCGLLSNDFPIEIVIIYTLIIKQH